MTNIKSKILGFSKKEVDELLKKIQSAHEMELEDLLEKIKTCRSEQDLLEQELIILNDQNTSFTSTSLLEYALRKVESATDHIDQTAEEDVMAIQKSIQQICSLFEPTRWFWGEQLESLPLKLRIQKQLDGNPKSHIDKFSNDFGDEKEFK